ncbi:hypothetical protein ACUTAH_24690 [Metapseudomonas furukawaii]|uniref:hypothetical protein n=1 Tax=Metapseudomonas furukawaii TaxID=1149133 RepID=UPI0040458C6F
MSQDKRWDGLTHDGELPIGLYYAGTRHRAFTLRVGVAGDLIAAQDSHPSGSMQLLTLAVFQRQLLRLGDIPTEALTLELLRDNLTEVDLAALAEADAFLEKKLMTPSEASTPGVVSSTHSPNAASAAPTSEA